MDEGSKKRGRERKTHLRRSRTAVEGWENRKRERVIVRIVGYKRKREMKIERGRKNVRKKKQSRGGGVGRRRKSE